MHRSAALSEATIRRHAGHNWTTRGPRKRPQQRSPTPQCSISRSQSTGRHSAGRRMPCTGPPPHPHPYPHTDPPATKPTQPDARPHPRAPNRYALQRGRADGPRRGARRARGRTRQSIAITTTKHRCTLAASTTTPTLVTPPPLFPHTHARARARTPAPLRVTAHPPPLPPADRPMHEPTRRAPALTHPPARPPSGFTDPLAPCCANRSPLRCDSLPRVIAVMEWIE